MPYSPADSKVFSPLFSDPEIGAILSDEVFVRRMLDVEAALAKVQGALGIIPVEAATHIGEAAAELKTDYPAMQSGIEKAGVPIIELVRQLRKQTGERGRFRPLGSHDARHYGHSLGAANTRHAGNHRDIVGGDSA
jgi:3-carboxy-cis,cis-muconate cycloisomerase